MSPPQDNNKQKVEKEEETPSIKLVPGPISGKYDKTDLNASYSNTSIKIECSGNSVNTVEGASFAEGKLTISKAGTYILQGQLQGQVYINTEENDLVQLVLNGITINSNLGPAIYEVQSQKLVVTTVGENTLTDSTNYPPKEKKNSEKKKEKSGNKKKKENENLNTAINACLLATHDLTLNGHGTLTVTGNYDEGIRSKSHLKLVSGTINIKAVGKGIKGKNSVSVKEAVITVDAGDSAIKATEDTDPEKGYVVIDGGRLTLKAGNDGIHAETHLTIRDGYINVTESVEGLEGQMIDMIGGEVHVKASDDGINASKIGAVNEGPPGPPPGGFPGGLGGPGGPGRFPGGPGGLGGFPGGPPGGFPGGPGGGMPPPPPHGEYNPEQDEQVYIRITGGTLYVAVEGNDVDAIDSNGSLYIGGKAVVYVTNGNGDIYGCMAALDADGSNVVDVGTTIVATASGMGGFGPGGPGGFPGGPGGPSPGLPPQFDIDSLTPEKLKEINPNATDEELNKFVEFIKSHPPPPRGSLYGPRPPPPRGSLYGPRPPPPHGPPPHDPPPPPIFKIENLTPEKLKEINPNATDEEINQFIEFIKSHPHPPPPIPPPHGGPHGPRELRPIPPPHGVPYGPPPSHGSPPHGGPPGRPGSPGGPGGPGGPPGTEKGTVKQANLQLIVDSQQAGTEIIVKDSKGQVIISHKPETVFSKILISTPKLKEGDTYSVTVGDKTEQVKAIIEKEE